MSDPIKYPMNKFLSVLTFNVFMYKGHNDNPASRTDLKILKDTIDEKYNNIISLKDKILKLEEAIITNSFDAVPNEDLRNKRKNPAVSTELEKLRIRVQNEINDLERQKNEEIMEKTFGHTKVYARITEIINTNKNIDIIFLQEDMSFRLEKSKKIMDELGFTCVSYCFADKYFQKINPTFEIPNYLINTVYINKKLLTEYYCIADNDPTKQDLNQTFEKCRTTFRAPSGEIVEEITNRCFTNIILFKTNQPKRETLERLKDDEQIIDYIILSNTHICGGKFYDDGFADKTKRNIKSEQFKLILDNINGENTPFTTILDKYNLKFKNSEALYSGLPTIIAGDFNSIHPLLYKSKHGSHIRNSDILKRQLGNVDLDNEIRDYMCDGHKLLEDSGLHTVLHNESTTKFNTVVDYIYFDPTKLAHVNTEVIYTLDVSDHNAVLCKYNMMNHYHKYYENNYNHLYLLTIKSINISLDLFKKYAHGLFSDNIIANINKSLEERSRRSPNIIKTNNDYIINNKIVCNNRIELSYLTYYLYNLFYTNIIDKNIKTILDTYFSKTTIPKGTVFFNGFNGSDKDDIITILFKEFYETNKEKINSLREDYKKLTEDKDNQTLKDNVDKKTTELLDIFKSTNKDIDTTLYNMYNGINYPNNSNIRMFTGILDIFNKKRHGGIYTTSTWKSPDINFEPNEDDTQNLNLSVSTKYFGSHAAVLNLLGVYVTNDIYQLYDLHPKNFYVRKLFRRLLSMLITRGKYNFDIPNNIVNSLYNNGNTPAFVGLSFDCSQLLNSKLYINENEKKPDLPPLYKDFKPSVHCIEGYWDGDNTIHESIINHFMAIYNSLNDDKIVGYISLDSGFDTTLKQPLFGREIVWFNGEQNLKPIGLIFKNHFTNNLVGFFNILKNYVSDHFTSIIKKEKVDLTYETLTQYTKSITEIISRRDTFLKVSPNPFYITDRDENIKKLSLAEFNIELSKNLIHEIITTDKKQVHVYRGGSYKEKYLKYKNKYYNLKNSM